MGWWNLMVLVATAAGATAERVNWAGEDASALVSTEAGLAWASPQDGGTPRTTARVVAVAPRGRIQPGT